MKNLKITEEHIYILNEELTIRHGYIVNVDKITYLIQNYNNVEIPYLLVEAFSLNKSQINKITLVFTDVKIENGKIVYKYEEKTDKYSHWYRYSTTPILYKKYIQTFQIPKKVIDSDLELIGKFLGKKYSRIDILSDWNLLLEVYRAIRFKIEVDITNIISRNDYTHFLYMVAYSIRKYSSSVKKNKKSTKKIINNKWASEQRDLNKEFRRRRSKYSIDDFSKEDLEKVHSLENIIKDCVCWIENRGYSIEKMSNGEFCVNFFGDVQFYKDYFEEKKEIPFQIGTCLRRFEVDGLGLTSTKNFPLYSLKSSFIYNNDLKYSKEWSKKEKHGYHTYAKSESRLDGNDEYTEFLNNVEGGENILTKREFVDNNRYRTFAYDTVDKYYHLIQTNMRRVDIDDYLSWENHSYYYKNLVYHSYEIDDEVYSMNTRFTEEEYNNRLVNAKQYLLNKEKEKNERLKMSALSKLTKEEKESLNIILL